METETTAPVATLRRILHERGSTGQLAEMIAGKDRVTREYGRMFSPERLEHLTADDFKGFLRYENNQHWWQIHRQQTQLVSDMTKLRAAFAVLVDEQQPLAARYDQAARLKGLGRAVMTPILQVVYPDRYGVWNSITEEAMIDLGLWPTFAWGMSDGERYEQLNGHLLRIASEVGTDLWTLDSLWWAYLDRRSPGPGSSSYATHRSATSATTTVCDQCFSAKASHLVDNGLCIDCR